jgi:hypothetical protein
MLSSEFARAKLFDPQLSPQQGCKQLKYNQTNYVWQHVIIDMGIKLVEKIGDFCEVLLNLVVENNIHLKYNVRISFLFLKSRCKYPWTFFVKGYSWI